MTAVAVTDKGFTAADGAVVFIGADSAVAPCKGDLLVKGTVDDDIALPRELHLKYEVITVLSVKRCTGRTGRLDHWEVTGK